jgi:hypothetical protein
MLLVVIKYMVYGPIKLYSASSCILTRNCYCPPARRSCMIHRQGGQDSPYASQVLLHKSSKLNLRTL